MARAVSYDEGVVLIMGNLAWLALKEENWSKAEALAREALPLTEKLGRQQLIASTCARLAEALVRQDKTAEALPYAQRAVEIYTKLESQDLAAAQATLRLCEESRPRRGKKQSKGAARRQKKARRTS